ncbi:hypothetical protein Tco_1326648 [Tanacetum coccineum]
MATCFCGRRTNIITSWTNENLGRCFHGCPDHGIVDWFDPPMCHRAVSIIPTLLRTRNRQDAQLLDAQRGCQRMKKLLDQDMGRLQLFRIMVCDSYHRVRRKRWFINMVTEV